MTFTSGTSMFRRNHARRWTRVMALAGAVGVLLGWCPSAPCQSAALQTAEVAEIAAAVRAPASSEEERTRAVEALIARLPEEQARAVLQEGLWDDRPAGIRRIVALAVAESDADCSVLVRSLGTALAASIVDGGSGGDAAALIRALGRHRSKAAAQALMENVVIPEGIEASLVEAAIDGLNRSTGRRDGGRRAEGWRRWWREARWVPDEDWSAEIAGGVPQAEEARELGDRVALLYKRLHAATAESGRDALLVEMLESPEAGVRHMGFELIMLALVNAKPVGDAVAGAAAARLDDADPLIRGEAARTIELLGRAEDAERLRRALGHEEDASAAAAMLRAAARRPDGGLMGPALAWFGRSADGAARSAAAEALASCLSAGMQVEADELARVAASLRSKPVRDWTEAEFRLGVAMGAFDGLAPALTSPDRKSAVAAADAFAADPRALARLIEAAGGHPDLFSAAATGVRAHAANADGYGTLASLPAPSEEARSAALAQVAAAMSPAELHRVARGQATPAAVDALLAPIITPEYLAAPAEAAERVDLALLLARSRVRLGRPADALSAVALLPPTWQGPRVVALRITALLCMERLPDAVAECDRAGDGEEAALTAAQAADAWLDALEVCASAGLRAAFEERYVSALTPEQQSRWRALQRP